MLFDFSYLISRSSHYFDNSFHKILVTRETTEWIAYHLLLHARTDVRTRDDSSYFEVDKVRFIYFNLKFNQVGSNFICTQFSEISFF